MDIVQILSCVDHTLLSPTATWQEIREICDDGIKYRTASVCIPPSFVARASAHVSQRVRICTVIGFPNGYSTTPSKCFEATEAVCDGADEIDMVINLGYVKEGRYDLVLDEIKRVKSACRGRTLKVIIETCVLTREEKQRMCEVVSQSGADFIKTSTGFSTAGATREDIELFAAHVAANVKIKAAGGIASLEDAQAFIELGASRLGTSRIVKLVKEL